MHLATTLAVLVTLFAVAPTVSSQNIVEVAANEPTLSTFVSLLGSANNANIALTQDGPFTVFAPSNEAFGKLPQETIDFLTDPANVGDLEAALYYHVIDSFLYNSTALIDLAPAEIATLIGEDVAITVDNGMVKVNTATVTTADIAADNGIIHIIDEVLIAPESSSQPPASSGNIVEVAANEPTLSTFYSLLGSANNANIALTQDGPFTVFAPSNEAFGKLPQETIDFLTDPANVGDLEAALYYHVIDSFLYNSTALIDLAPAAIATLIGEDVAITVDNGMVKVNTATVTTADIAADNGIIHIIDEVLVAPESPPQAPTTEAAPVAPAPTPTPMAPSSAPTTSAGCLANVSVFVIAIVTGFGYLLA